MNSEFSLKLENKVAEIVECNMQLKSKSMLLEDTNYTLKIKRQYIRELVLLIQGHPELSQHPALSKIKSDLPGTNPD